MIEMITLRDYQIEARDSILAEWEKGIRSTFAMLCTGAGKTEIALSVLASERTEKTRFLGIAHRKELIHQPRDRVIAHWQDQLPVPGIVMADQDDCDAEFVMASIQTLKGDRLKKCLEHGVFTHLWLDENHHSPSKTYQILIDYLRNENDALRIFGVTATPLRADKIGMAAVFESCAYRFPIDKGIKAGALCPFVGIGIELPVDFSGIPETQGESGWDDEKAGELLSLANVEEVIIENWKKHAIDRRTIVFTSSVAQAYSLAAAYRAAGFSAEAIDGNSKTTPPKRRDDVLRRHKSGELQIIVNDFVLGEGYDDPEVSCIVVAKPTKSDSRYTQLVGRGLRILPGKTCVVLDFAPRGARNMRMAGDLLGKPRHIKDKEKKLSDRGVILDCFGINRDGESIEGDPDEVETKILDYLGSSHLAWTYDGQVSTVSIAPQTALVIVAPQLKRIEKANQLKEQGQWATAWEVEYQRICSYQVYAIENNRSVVQIGSEPDWQGASYLAADYADLHAEQWLSERDKRWRNKPVGEKQAQFCKRLGVWRESMRCGEASQAITHALTIKTLQKNGILRGS